jgi:hypothetical protein
MRDKRALLAGVMGLMFLLSGCIPDLGSSGDDSDALSTSSQSSQTDRVTIQALGLPTVSDDEWDDTAVRKVLHTFAYGGHATDAQIATWADMPPDQAIAEMLTFEEHNPLLSPVTASNYDQLDMRDGTLRGLGEFWSSDDPGNGIPEESRETYRIDKWAVDHIWVKAATSRGLNPFRQKIGLWETNYHLVANMEATVSRLEMVRYYDDIMAALEGGTPYQDVLTAAATSSAIATQYGHFGNRFKNGICFCNEDFAREYHQLFFGVLGDYNPDYHETVTIKNTARALTDMSIERNEVPMRTGNISFGVEFHYPGLLEILETDYWGEDMPDRIGQLSQDEINHPESLDNLPVMIISGLADDNLNDAKMAQIRSAWAAMQPKDLLAFLRAYAVSTLFHSEDRIKYLSSIDRHMLLANKFGLNNEENYLNLHGVARYTDEDVRVFRPTHNVFGSQTGVEASISADVFRNNYNWVTRSEFRYRAASGERSGRLWEREWQSIVPMGATGEYVVRDVAEWLWNRFIGDGLKHFGPLERAHVYALLASTRDLNYLVSPEDLSRVITAIELETESALIALVNSLSTQTLPLDSIDTDEKRYANERIGQAINFIVATPYISAQEGR